VHPVQLVFRSTRRGAPITLFPGRPGQDTGLETTGKRIPASKKYRQGYHRCLTSATRNRVIRSTRSYGTGMSSEIRMVPLLTEYAESSSLNFSTPLDVGKKLIWSLNAAKWTRLLPSSLKVGIPYRIASSASGAAGGSWPGAGRVSPVLREETIRYRHPYP